MVGRYRCSISSRTGHVTTETVFRQTLALWLGKGDEHCDLESDTTGLNVKWNLYLYCSLIAVLQGFKIYIEEVGDALHTYSY